MKKRNLAAPAGTINFVEALNSRTLKREEQSLKRYLNVLDFDQLVTESEHILGKLKEGPLKSEIALHAKLLLNEINHRIDSSDKKLFISLGAMRSNLERKILNIVETGKTD